MTPRLLALQSLRDKLRVATGPLPDETVAEVLALLCPDQKEWQWSLELERKGSRWTHDTFMVNRRIYEPHELPDRSLDGALRLVPKGYWWRAGGCLREQHAAVGPEDSSIRPDQIEAFGATAPLALLLAVVEARIVEEEGHE